MPRALFSVTPFDGMCDLAARLARLGWSFVATGAARLALEESGLEAMDVAEFNGVAESFEFPPTLHPRLERALTGEAAERIDLVFDIPYGLEVGNDVGGRTLLALAAKGDRLVASSPGDLEMLIAHLEQGAIPEDLRRRLRAGVNLEIGRHFLRLTEMADPDKHLAVDVTWHAALANGENPYQVPAWLGRSPGADPLALTRFVRLSGEEPCYTNLADLDAILTALARIHAGLCRNAGRAPHIAIAAKHGNPCGIGVDWCDPKAAVEKALWGHPQAVWGGEFICNFAVDGAIGRMLCSSQARHDSLGSARWMLHVIAAPHWTEDAVAALSGNPVRKLLVNASLAAPTLDPAMQFRQVRGGALVQPPPSYVLDLGEVCWDAYPIDDPGRRTDLILAWAAVFSAAMGGNEVALVKDGQLIGIGGGPATVDAARAAAGMAASNRHDTAG